MPDKRIPIHEEIKGALGQHEDWWTLIVNSETGERSVEHEWSYVDPYQIGNKNSGVKVVAVAEFLQGESTEVVKSKLNALLENLQ